MKAHPHPSESLGGPRGNAARKYLIVCGVVFISRFGQRPSRHQTKSCYPFCCCRGSFQAELFQLDLSHWDGRNMLVCGHLTVHWRPDHQIPSPSVLEGFRSRCHSCPLSLCFCLFFPPPNTAFCYCDVNGGYRKECLSPFFLEQATHNHSSEQWIKLPNLSK